MENINLDYVGSFLIMTYYIAIPVLATWIIFKSNDGNPPSGGSGLCA